MTAETFRIPLRATFTDFALNTFEDAVTAGAQVALLAGFDASIPGHASALNWDWLSLAGAFGAGFVTSVLTSLAKRKLGAINQTNIFPAVDPSLNPAHRA